MRTSTVLAPLLGAAAVSAASAGLTPRAMSLFPRQITSSSIPSACQDTCTSTIAIYQACTSNDADGCLKVCSQDTFNELIACFTCVLDDADSVSASEQRQLNSAIDQLKAACSQAGSSVTGGLENKVTSSTASGSSASATDSAVESIASGATSAISGFTSAASGTTIAAGTTIVGGGPNGASTIGASTTPASGTSAAGSAATSAASSAASDAAGALSAAGPVLSAGKYVGAGAALVAAVMML
ncbi:hypothetical protein IAT38_002403 [Cryptococcus sp. DSM 104549]